MEIKLARSVRSDISKEVAVALTDEAKKQLCVDLLQEFGATKIHSNGAELQHNCTLPFGMHSDNNSMAASVNFKKLEFNCYVCQSGGSIQWWIAVNRGLESGQVNGWLQNQLGHGTQMPLVDRLRIIDSIVNPPSTKPEPMPVYNDKVLKRFHEYPYHPYLTKPHSEGGREIPQTTLDEYEIGYALDDEDFRYYRRIIIPARWKGRIVGWQARRLDKSDPDYDIKYKNSPSFPRDRILYGAYGQRHAVAVESPMSVLRHAHQRPLVSTFGAKVTEAQFRLLQSFDTLTLFPDPDKAGFGWTRTMINKLSRHVRLDVVDSPYEKADAADLDDLTFENLVNSAVPAALWQPKRYRDMIPYTGG